MPFLQSSALLLALALGAAGALAEPVTVRSDEPQLPPRTLTLQEQWRVGGEDGDLLFGMMIDSVEDEAGNVYLLDAQLGEVSVISPDGEYLRTISGRGEGPGEVQMPQNLLFLPDGALGILEAFPAHVVTMDTEGVPGPEITIGVNADGAVTGFRAAFQIACRNGSILLGGQRSTPSDVGQARTQYLASISAAGEELVRYRESHMVLDFTRARFVETEMLPPFLLASALDGEGRAYCARSHDDYAIEVYGTDGSLEKVIERRFEPRRRTDREMSRLNALIDAWIQGFPGELERVLEKTEPTIDDLHVDDRGVLWVKHSRSGDDRPGGVLLTYDTFAPDGRWLQQVAIRGEGDPMYDGIRFLGDDRVLLIRGYVLARWASRGALNVDFGEEEAQAMEVICCRLVES